jgi:FKBP-type peptidyl-prolyl cis-trans isomerase SlpA
VSGPVAHGRRVTLEYRLLLQDGTLVDAAEAGEPLSFVVGDGTLDAGLEGCLLGMTRGEAARFLLGPGEAFGQRDPANRHRLPRADFPSDMAVEAGTIIEFQTPAGATLPGAVLASDAETVEVDFNHPLAERPFTFEVRVVDVD